MADFITILSAATAVDDRLVRQQGMGLIDGSIPGYILLMGDDIAQAQQLFDSIKDTNILVFVDDAALSDKLKSETHTVSMHVTDALGFIARVAMLFGNNDDPQAVLNYTRERLRGFAVLLGEPTPERLALAQTAAILGCPFLSHVELPASGYGWESAKVISGVAPAEIAQMGIEERGLQIHVPIPELPVSYSADFSGQVVRDDACGACLSGVELTTTGDNIVDGQITVIGPDLDAGLNGNHPYAILVEVSGRAMQPDFEPVLERQIETLLNALDGVVHRGQRANATLRITQKAIDKGLRLYHLGEILHACYHNEYANILSRAQITFFTDPVQIQAITERAQATYAQRDKRLSGLVDEDVDTFYTCNLCQTIAAGHLCVISPEHPGTCGAVDWMDARAAVSIRPVGHNKPAPKDGLIDVRLGQWKSVNQIVQQESGGALEGYSLYSMMQDPSTACGDFECITAMLPLPNGVMVVENTYDGITPSGMDWPMLYEMVGTGTPIPGFIGHSKRAWHRDKFISAEGGWRRIVWMNHTLREELRPFLDTLAAEAGIPGFVDMIATENDALTEDEILAHMETVAHPALAMEPMI